MKIAIIGGGAAGITTAYLLDHEDYNVTVFEKESILGGHIRTLNKNVQNKDLENDMILEGGVIEFSHGFKMFRSLLDELNVPTQSLNIGTGLFMKNSSHLLSPIMIDHNFNGLRIKSPFSS